MDLFNLLVCLMVAVVFAAQRTRKRLNQLEIQHKMSSSSSSSMFQEQKKHLLINHKIVLIRGDKLSRVLNREGIQVLIVRIIALTWLKFGSRELLLILEIHLLFWLMLIIALFLVLIRLGFKPIINMKKICFHSSLVLGEMFLRKLKSDVENKYAPWRK